MENQEEITKTEEEESILQADTLMERLGELTEKRAVGVKTNIIAFVGPTKSGKSTLINCLLGTKLVYKYDESSEETFILKADELSGPKIGGKGESETDNPQCCEFMSDTNYEMWDFPGFGDNKGTAQEIVNAISYQTVLLAAESVRFVLVVPCNMIKDDNHIHFYEILNALHTICPEIADSLYIVFTKFDRGNTKKLLEDAKDKTFLKTDKTNLNIINQGKKQIEKILNNNNYIDFKYPKMGEDEDKIFILPNKLKFIDCISKLRGTKVKDFPLVISDKAKLVIANLHTLFYSKLKDEVENMNLLIDSYIENALNEILEAKEDGKLTSAKLKLDAYERGKRTIEDIIEKSQNFKSFFDQVRHVGINELFPENVEKFIYVEKLKNMYKMNEAEVSSRGEEEFLISVKITLKNGAKEYSKQIATSEAATEEEKAREIKWQNDYNEEITFLNKHISYLKIINTSILLKVARFIQPFSLKHSISIMNGTGVVGSTKTEQSDLDDPDKKIKIQNLQESREKYSNLSKETDKTYNNLKEINKNNSCQILLVKHIDYNNPLLNKPLLLKSFSDLYGTKALSYLINLTEVLSEDSSESLQEISGSPHALEMFATMIGLS